MSATTIVHALLSVAPGVTALAGVRVYPTMLPEGVPTPALVHEEISTVDLGTINAQQPYALRRSRVQINALALQFADAAALLAAACAAVQFQRGSIAGKTVVSILRDRTGPNGFDPDLNLHHHIADLMVTWQDP